MKILTITCVAVATFQLAAVVTSSLNRESEQFNEIAMCITQAPPNVAQASIIPIAQGSSADQDFVIQAADAGRAEVALGKLASEKASSGKVKDFGKMMVADHTKANEELKSLADKKGIKIATECELCQQKLAQLDKLSEKEFDTKYMEMMVADHKEVIQKFTTESTQGKDSDVKAWAAQKLPALKHHLEAAQNLKP